MASEAFVVAKVKPEKIRLFELRLRKGLSHGENFDSAAICSSLRELGH